MLEYCEQFYIKGLKTHSMSTLFSVKRRTGEIGSGNCCDRWEFAVIFEVKLRLMDQKLRMNKTFFLSNRVYEKIALITL